MKATLKIPDTTKDMTVEQLPFLVAITELCDDLSKVDQDFFDNLDPITISDLNTMFFNAEPGAFDIYTKESNKKILAEIVYSIARHEEEPIKIKRIVDGVTYVFNTDFSKMPVVFWRDIKRADFAENPLDLVAFCYLEEGMVYNEVDKHNNVLNPKRERGEKFKDISLAEYMDLQGFFLNSWNVLSPYLKAKEALKK